MKRYPSSPQRLTWFAALLLTPLAVACDPILGFGGARLAPTITGTTPSDGAIDVPIANTFVDATFSEPMTGAATLTVTCEAPCASPVGTVTLDDSGRIAAFTLADGTTLAPLTRYTATVAGATSIASGLPLDDPFVWRFTTGATPDLIRPRVILTVPATTTPGPTPDVPTNAAITATFTEDMAPASLTGASFTIRCASPCASPDGIVSYAAGTRTAVFTSDTALEPGTTYTATVTTAATDLAGNALAGSQAALPAASDYLWTFTTGVLPDTTRPRVTLTVPVTTISGPTPDVATDTLITALFSEDMAPATVSAATFTVTCETPCVSPIGVVSYAVGAQTATFQAPTALMPATRYTATITSAVTDLTGNTLAGNQPVALPGQSDYVWTFLTDIATETTRPRVTATVPATTAPGPTLVVQDPVAISATFSEDMAPATISPASFTVRCAAPCVSPAGIVSYAVAGRTALFTLADALEPDTTYTATVTAPATDLAGNALAGNQAALPAASDYVWTFKTAPADDVTAPRVNSTVPATLLPDGLEDVSANTPITTVFSEDMAPGTINGASFTVTCDNPCVSPLGVVSYAAGTRTATFAHAATLADATTYTATISAAATDLFGNPLAGNQAALPAASDYVWTFTTADTTRPTVTATAPDTTTPGPTPEVALSAAIGASFSEDMDPATINATSFVVTCEAPCVAPTGTVSYSVDTRAVVFVPDALLRPESLYTVTISTLATDLAGNALGGNQAPLPAASNYVWTFATAPPLSISARSPTADAVGMCPSATIDVTFTVPSGSRMDPLTVDGDTFTVTKAAPDLTPVTPLSISLDELTGRTATFTPLVALTEGTRYTVTLRGDIFGVKDLATPPNAMLADARWSFTVGPATGHCLAPLDLGAAASFATFGGSSGMTNQGLLTVINGDIGTTAVSTAVTGFHDRGAGCTYTETPLNVAAVNGSIYTAPPAPTVACPSEGTAITFAIALAARAAALSAYNALVALPGGPDPGAGNLANLTLAPGVYTSASGSFMIEGGDLTLDAQGDPNAVWVFQMATTLTVGGPGAAFPQSIVMANGALAKNVFWQVGSHATIDAAGGGTMYGTIISQSGASFSTAGNVAITTLNGRVFSLGASVTLVNTIINVPAP